MLASSLHIEKLGGLPEGVALYLCPFVPEEGRGERALEQEVTLDLLRHALGQDDVAELSHRSSGAPYLPQYPELSVSISHARGIVAVLLAPSSWAVGIDVEHPRPQLLRVKAKYLHEGESEMLVPSLTEELRALTLLWSAKEALYKMLQPPSESLLDFRLIGHRREGDGGGTLLFSYFVHPSHDYSVTYHVYEHHVLCYSLSEAR